MSFRFRSHYYNDLSFDRGAIIFSSFKNAVDEVNNKHFFADEPFDNALYFSIEDSESDKITFYPNAKLNEFLGLIVQYKQTYFELQTLNKQIYNFK